VAATVTRNVIRDLPTEERPRERLRMRGAETLSNAELMAILLRTGSAGENVLALSQRLLSTFDGLRVLGKVSFGELAGQHSMGDAKACQVLAAIELGRRVSAAVTPEAARFIKDPADVYAMLFAEMALLQQEELKILMLSTRNEVLSVKTVYRGNVSAAIVRQAEVFKDAVREGCPSIIMVHNHPSGDPDPSAEDVSLTREAIQVGKLLGVEVLDHIVLARSGFVSMKDRHLAFA